MGGGGGWQTGGGKEGRGGVGGGGGGRGLVSIQTGKQPVGLAPFRDRGRNPRLNPKFLTLNPTPAMGWRKLQG